MLRPVTLPTIWLLLVVELAAAGHVKETKTEFYRQHRESFDPNNKCGLTSYSDQKYANRISGGRPMRPGEMPWLVRIGDHCPGVIIDERYILTASKCLWGGDHEPVYVGCHNTIENCTKVSITNWSEHNDIALLRISEPLEFKLTPDGYGSVNRICMPERHDGDFWDLGRPVSAIWGTQEMGDQAPWRIDGLAVRQYGFCRGLVVDRDREIGPDSFDAENQYCTMDGSCQERLKRDDFGAPLMKVRNNKFELYGIATYIRQGRGFPSFELYTRIPTQLKWIKMAKKDLANESE